MKQLSKVFSAVFILCLLTLSGLAKAQQEAPDALIKRISQEVLSVAKQDSEIQSGNHQRVLDLVEEKVLPHVDFPRMTALAAGRFWRDATPQQQKDLTREFRTLLVYTYSGAVSQIKDQKLEFKPFRANPEDTDVEVRTQVVQARGEPIQLNYRLANNGSEWKIYDVNVLGAWLVETYKGNFATEIRKNGIDGLIKALAERNAKLAASLAKANKRSR